MSNVWTTPGITDRLLELNGEAWSATRIARALGAEFRVQVSRNSVIGKLNRIGLGLKTSGNHDPGSRRLQTARRPPKPKAVKAADVQAPPFIGPIGDFPKSGCKFTSDDVGQPGWRMCGQPVHAPGASWCQYHAFDGMPGVDLVFERQRTEASRQKGESAELSAIQDRNMRRMGLG